MTPAVYAEIERAVRSDPRFAAYGGSTLHDGTVVFQNFTGGDEAAYEQGLRVLLDKVPANLQLGRAAYTGEYLDGIGAYLRHTGQRADVLRRAAHLLRTKLAPLYERAAREHGGNPAATVESIRQTAAALGRAADTLDAGGTVEDAEAAFSRVLSEGAPSRDSRLFPPTERFAITGAAALGASQTDDDRKKGALAAGALALATGRPGSFFERTFSRLGRAIEWAPFERGTAEQWVAALAKGVAKSEREWTGIDRFLAQHAGQVLSKDQVRPRR